MKQPERVYKTLLIWYVVGHSTLCFQRGTWWLEVTGRHLKQHLLWSELPATVITGCFQNQPHIPT